MPFSRGHHFLPSLMRTRSSLLFVVLLFLSGGGPAGSLCSAEVVHLTDGTFEHQTQATTGSTTGSWLVLFGIPTCDTCQTVRPHLDELSRDGDLYEKGIVIGSVDCTESAIVCSRFGIEKVPALLYLHRGLLYHVPQQLYHQEPSTAHPAEGGEKEDEAPVQEQQQQQQAVILDTLRSFVLKDFSAVADAQVIPRPPSWFDANIAEPFAGVYASAQENTLLGIAILLMSTMLILTLIVLIVMLISTSGSSSSSTTSGTATGKGGKRKKKD
jgi:hypothetical protein